MIKVDEILIKRAVFVLIFLFLSVMAFNIHLSHIRFFSDDVKNAPKTFTLFQFIGPTAGAFLSTSYGIFVVILAQIIDFIIKGKEFVLANILFIFPSLGAVYFFSVYVKNNAKKDLVTYVIPIISILLFAVHPVGGQALLYTGFWLIPIVVKFLPRNLFLRSLGATFTTHAIGSTIWLYLFDTSPLFWYALIPIVIVERVTFALGISVTFVLLNTLINALTTRFIEITRFINVEKEYVINLSLWR
ncbi:MAG: hypothetical protein N3E37_03990 [Candidatus Micrarchaeota archaeon]|nr:hypothetical protein [Candidatus Micrarchaeota archaeon]